MRRYWFNRLLLSYLPAFFLLILSLILIFFLFINEQNKKQAIFTNEMMSRQTIQSIDNALKSIDDLIIQNLYTNLQMKQVFDQHRERDPFEYYQVITALRSIKSTNPLINSIYLFRKHDQMVLSENTMVPLEQFGDEDFISLNMADAENDGWTNIRSFKEFPNDSNPVNVVSLLRKAPLPAGDQGLVVINVDARTVQQYIEKLINRDLNFIQLYDGNGRLFYDTAMQFQDVENFRETIGKELSRMKSPYTNWEFRSGIRDGALYNFVSFISYVWIFALGLVLLAGFGYIIFITRQNYKPVMTILNRLQTYSLKKNSALDSLGEKDEFNYIEKSFERLIEDTNHYQEKVEENKLIRRQYFFQELMNGGGSISFEGWQKDIAELGLKDKEAMKVAIVEIDKFHSFAGRYTINDQKVLKYVISYVIMEISNSNGVKVWSEWITSHQLGVLIQQHAQQSIEQTSDILNQARQWVQENLQFTITIGIGETVYEAAGLSQCYDEAVEALLYKATIGRNKVIEGISLPAVRERILFNFPEILSVIIRSFCTGEAWEEMLEELFSEIESRYFTKDEIANHLHYMLFQFDRDIRELPQEIHQHWQANIWSRLNATIQSFDVLDEAKYDIVHILREASQHIAYLRENRSAHRLIQNMKSYIETEYHNPDLSLMHLSEAFSLSPYYLSKLFKEEFGEKFVDFLARIRIDTAKRLLMETQSSIQDIARKVGYINVITFNRIFKKMEGSTPGSYRKKASS
ncbi:helix-turn-helix domain-containing protein [Paenibacillus sp. N3.4]|uniref:helix-turn-helix domain-containing protein n=1 Tax=Paenibacillus sp. N3.4 TaxID=2603222 RepID=UPI0011C77B46|nr:helix-turn-helix domain-containing protein [Paenibacillus sp. N3.4]TXK84462.1 helix-turn-helix domain-containing protein [Paenibacillus sp. N3.4]